MGICINTCACICICMTDIIRVILYVCGDGAACRRPTWPMTVPEGNALSATHQQTTHRGAPFCSPASALSGVSSVRRAAAAAAAIHLGSPPLPPCPGPWALGPQALASAGPHTLSETPLLADQSGLQCVYIVSCPQCEHPRGQKH